MMEDVERGESRGWRYLERAKESGGRTVER